MRATFVRTLVEIAQEDPRVALLVGDLGFMVVEPFAEQFPDRFVNVGVAEQNMLGVATGLAEAGYIPFCYSIATFASMRPYEFFRNGAILQELPVRVVAVGGGFEYGSAGPTHHALEDIAVMRTQPGLTVIAPADALQAETALRATWDLPGPVYFRLGKDDRRVVEGLAGEFRLGGLQSLREGRDVVLIAMGAAAADAVTAADELGAAGISAGVAVVASVNPPPADELEKLLSDVGLAVTVEAHYAVGGLGSLVAEVIAEAAVPCRLVRCGVRAAPDGVSGSEAFLLARHDLSPRAIVQQTLRALGEAPT